MAVVRLEKIQQGMVLAEDVCDMNERLLLSKGVEIADQHIRILKMWGVYEVQVDSEDACEESQEPCFDSNQTRKIARALSSRFAMVDIAHPAIREILRLGIDYRLQRSGGDEPSIAMAPAAAIKTDTFKEIQKKIDRIDVHLPEVPSLVFELNEIIADPMSAAGDIARVVTQSPSLTAMLLKIVNSAYYGFRSKIDSISRAIMLIGSNEVSNLALGITIMENFRDIPRRVIDVNSFLEHSLACGIVARFLASYANISQTEQVFVSGMLHDIGRLVLCKYFPDAAAAMFSDAAHRHQPLAASERALINSSHGLIGKKLLKKWKLPYTLENNVYYHHNPSASPQPQQAAAVMLADLMVHSLGIGNSGEQMVSVFDSQGWESLKLSIGVLKPVVDQAVNQLDNLRQIMGGE